jgi:uncharacterized repeat protein (TIGR01451 family)
LVRFTGYTLLILLNINNILENEGWGVYCYQYSSPLILGNTIFKNGVNYCDGIHCYIHSSPIIVNNLIIANLRSGIHCENNSSPNVINNTIHGNTVHGVRIYDHCSPDIFNNIITENGTTGSFYGIYAYYFSYPVIDYNCVWGNGLGGNNNYGGSCATGTHEISVNPQFVYPGNYHLKETSPCIDKGSSTVLPAGITTDKDNNPRIVNDIVDMGAYEYQGIPTFADVWIGIDKYRPSHIAQGDNIVYHIHYGNAGNKEATQVNIVDTLPQDVSYISDTSGIVPNILGKVITWYVGTLSPATNKYFKLIGKVASSTTTEFLNIVEIDSSNDTCLLIIYLPLLPR